ncbi:TetR/AcrR family transcriptional regulator [Streptomyces sp. URMC 123]|uniref:TetR/AcrR family transcriptional regulator n=1 Tax=Streptomyces sp. URMC 123 TaxID=3423403 RepID=UPI003F1E4146
MPTARDSLLDAAFAALSARPWPAVRMVDVAAAAGVSRQTLYNEFGSKDGLARALVRRETEAYLAGVERALTEPEDAGATERLAAVAEWTVRAARTNPLVRAVLTGCWGERLPAPATAPTAVLPVTARLPGQRRADVAPPSPTELLGQVCDRAVAVLDGGRPRDAREALSRASEAAVRLSLSYVLAPAAPGDMSRLIRAALTHPAARRRAPWPPGSASSG